MDMDALQCHGCGSTNVEFDAKRRVLCCHQCGKEEYYSRATLNASGKVVFAKRNAIKYFLDGRYENAQHYALEVVNISMDNAPALFIMGYYDEFVQKRTGALMQFFHKIQDVALEYDEVEEMRKLILGSAYNLLDYEAEIIQMIAANMQSPDDKNELNAFFDQICPYFISKRTSMQYLSTSLGEMYQELAAYCGVPKTCFALLKSIETNPDSPYANNTFYLSSKTKSYYQNYICKIEPILSSMQDAALRSKFMNAFQVKSKKYLADMEEKR